MLPDRDCGAVMITFGLFLFLLASEPNPIAFSGYQELPSPKAEDCVIVPLDNPQRGEILSYSDPVLKA